MAHMPQARQHAESLEGYKKRNVPDSRTWFPCRCGRARRTPDADLMQKGAPTPDQQTQGMSFSNASIARGVPLVANSFICG